MSDCKESCNNCIYRYDDDSPICDSKCDSCNCALHDCSLCGVSSFDETEDGTPIY